VLAMVWIIPRVPLQKLIRPLLAMWQRQESIQKFSALMIRILDERKLGKDISVDCNEIIIMLLCEAVDIKVARSGMQLSYCTATTLALGHLIWLDYPPLWIKQGGDILRLYSDKGYKIATRLAIPKRAIHSSSSFYSFKYKIV